MVPIPPGSAEYKVAADPPQRDGKLPSDPTGNHPDDPCPTPKASRRTRRAQGRCAPPHGGQPPPDPRPPGPPAPLSDPHGPANHTIHQHKTSSPRPHRPPPPLTTD